MVCDIEELGAGENLGRIQAYQFEISVCCGSDIGGFDIAGDTCAQVHYSLLGYGGWFFHFF